MELLNPNYKLNNVDRTIYWDQEFLFDGSDGLGAEALKGKTVIGLWGVVETNYVHHFTMYGFSNDGSEEMLYAWGPGTQPFALPDDVGINMANYDGVTIQTHFDNPNLDKNIVDNSGVRFYLAAEGEEREFDYGVLQLGDPEVQLTGQGVQAGLSRYTFDCPSLGATTPITLYTHGLHMHGIGARMITQHFRDGVQIGGNEIEHFNFDYQDLTYRNEEARPGDSFKTTCFYDTTLSSKDRVRFGQGSDDEMCIVSPPPPPPPPLSLLSPPLASLCLGTVSALSRRLRFMLAISYSYTGYVVTGRLGCCVLRVAVLLLFCGMCCVYASA